MHNEFIVIGTNGVQIGSFSYTSSAVGCNAGNALVNVDDVWGIDGRLSKRLHTMGIYTALQLADSNISMIRRSFDVIVERTVRELNGESCLALEDAPPPK
jgi:nucleotidyltransferase/DNA polymerase involved in DNA repair